MHGRYRGVEVAFGVDRKDFEVVRTACLVIRDAICCNEAIEDCFSRFLGCRWTRSKAVEDYPSGVLEDDDGAEPSHSQLHAK